MSKVYVYECPKCGSDDAVSVNLEWYTEDEFKRDCVCNCCKSKWTEYFKIIYDGYADESGEYDKYGEMTYDFNGNIVL